MEYQLLIEEYYDSTETFYSLHLSVKDAIEAARKLLEEQDEIDKAEIPAMLASLTDTKGLDVPGLFLTIETVRAPEEKGK